MSKFLLNQNFSSSATYKKKRKILWENPLKNADEN